MTSSVPVSGTTSGAVNKSNYLLSDFSKSATCVRQPCLLSHRLSSLDEKNHGKQYATRASSSSWNNTSIFPRMCVDCLLTRFGLYESSHEESRAYMNCIASKTQGADSVNRTEGVYLRAFRAVENILPEANRAFPKNCIIIPSGQILLDVFASDPNNLFIRDKKIPTIKLRKLRASVPYAKVIPTLTRAKTSTSSASTAPPPSSSTPPLSYQELRKKMEEVEMNLLKELNSQFEHTRQTTANLRRLADSGNVIKDWVVRTVASLDEKSSQLKSEKKKIDKDIKTAKTKETKLRNRLTKEEEKEGADRNVLEIDVIRSNLTNTQTLLTDLTDQSASRGDTLPEIVNIVTDINALARNTRKKFLAAFERIEAPQEILTAEATAIMNAEEFQIERVLDFQIKVKPHVIENVLPTITELRAFIDNLDLSFLERRIETKEEPAPIPAAVAQAVTAATVTAPATQPPPEPPTGRFDEIDIFSLREEKNKTFEAAGKVIDLANRLVAGSDVVESLSLEIDRLNRDAASMWKISFDYDYYVFSPYVYSYFAHLFHLSTAAAQVASSRSAATKKQRIEQLLCDESSSSREHCLEATYEVDLVLMSNLISPLSARSNYVRHGKSIVVSPSKIVEASVVNRSKDFVEERANDSASPYVTVNLTSSNFTKDVLLDDRNCLDPTKLQHFDSKLFAETVGMKRIAIARQGGLRNYFETPPANEFGEEEKILSASGLHVASFCVPSAVVTKNGREVYREHASNVTWMEGLGLVSTRPICQNELLVIDQSVNLENFIRAKLSNVPYDHHLKFEMPELERSALSPANTNRSLSFENRNLAKPKACLYGRM